MPRPLPRTLLRTAAALAAGTVLALAAPLAASAHVTLTADTAAAGSYALLTFKVPNESATATTTTLTVHLPADTPLASVSYVPVPGWTTRLVPTTLPQPVGSLTQAITSVVYTATGTGLSAGQLQTFPLSIGPVPNVGHLTIPVDQGYSDGTVVSWSDTTAGAAHPAPVLYVDDAPPTATGATGTPTASPLAAVTTTTGPGTTPPDVLARVLGIGGLAVGAIGIVLAVAARRPRRAA